MLWTKGLIDSFLIVYQKRSVNTSFYLIGIQFSIYNNFDSFPLFTDKVRRSSYFSFTSRIVS